MVSEGKDINHNKKEKKASKLSLIVSVLYKGAQTHTHIIIYTHIITYWTCCKQQIKFKNAFECKD